MLEAKNVAGKEQHYSQDYLKCILGLKCLTSSTLNSLISFGPTSDKTSDRMTECA